MPRGDGTGPLGMGPMTGRGAGYCAGFRFPGYLNFGGRSLGFGRGRGYRRLLLFGGLVPSGAYLAYRWFNRNKIR